MIVTLRHLFTIPYFSARRGFCRSKSKAWFVRHGLDWKGFVKDGLPEEVFLETGDGMAIALVEWTHACEAMEHAGG